VKVDEDQPTSSHGQEVEETKIAEGSRDPGATSTQLKYPLIAKRVGPRKKVKASKFSIDSITLTEGDLHDIDETVLDVTSEVLQDFM